MKKSKSWSIVLYCLFPILFNLLFFMLGGSQHPASVWIAYGFIHLAWLLLIATPLFSPGDTAEGTSILSAYSVSFIYFLAQLIMGLIIIILHPQTYKGPVILQAVLLLLYVAVLAPVLMANSHSAEKTGNIQRNSDELRDYCVRIRNLIDIASDEKVRRELKRTYNALQAAPVGNSRYLDDVYMGMKKLEAAIRENDTEEAVIICRKIQNIAG